MNRRALLAGLLMSPLGWALGRRAEAAPEPPRTLLLEVDGCRPTPLAWDGERYRGTLEKNR